MRTADDTAATAVRLQINILRGYFDTQPVQFINTFDKRLIAKSYQLLLPLAERIDVFYIQRQNFDAGAGTIYRQLRTVDSPQTGIFCGGRLKFRQTVNDIMIRQGYCRQSDFMRFFNYSRRRIGPVGSCRMTMQINH